MPTATPNLNYPGKLKYGDSDNKRITQLQERLKELGFFEGKTSTGFYAKTQAALKAFQTKNGLAATGVLDEVTWNMLYAEDVADVHCTPKPTAAPTPVPYFIEVDVANQLTKVYTRDENGEFTQLYKAFLCSTGTKTYPSTLGTFTLTSRRARWCTFPQWGGGTAQYWTRITAEIAFHSVLYRNYDPMQLVESSFKNLGSRASHGCVRLTVPDARWIYENCKAGVEVWIHDDAASDPELKYASKPGSIDNNTKVNKTTPAP